MPHNDKGERRALARPAPKGHTRMTCFVPGHQSLKTYLAPATLLFDIVTSHMYRPIALESISRICPCFFNSRLVYPDFCERARISPFVSPTCTVSQKVFIFRRQQGAGIRYIQ